MEDKQKICDLLLPALQATRNLSDLVGLEYIKDENGTETVRVTFGGVSVEAYLEIDVTADSGTAMIQDIVHGWVY